MSRGYSLKLSVVSMAVLAALSVQAAESDETMVVTASGYEQSVTDAAATISVLTREELENQYFRDINDALTSVPGVIVTGGGDQTEISIRGMGSGYTLILVDGQRVSTRLTRPNSDGPGIEQSWLPPLQAIERIEVIKGPMSTLYGSDAMGGVINIITRKTQQTWSGNIQLGTVIQEDTHSGDEQSANFFASGPLTDKLSLQVSAQSQQRDEDNIANGYSDRTVRSIGSKLTYQASDDHLWIFNAQSSRQQTRSNADKSYVTSTYNTGTYSEAKYYRSSASLEHKGNWGEVGQSDTFVQYEQSRNPSRDITVKNSELKSTMVTPFASNTFSYGLQGNYAKLEDKTTNTGGTLTELDNYTLALFAEDEWNVLDNVALTFGVRYDHDEKYGSNLSPRIYSVWGISDVWTLKGGVSTGFKAPNVKQSSDQWISVSRGGNTYGNPDLEPETSVTEEVSLEYQNESGTSVSVGLFNNDFNDMIIRETCDGSNCAITTNAWGNTSKTYANVDEAVTRGVEVAVELPLAETVDFNANYTYTYTKQETGDSAGEPLNNLPKDLFSAQLNWQTSADLQSWSKVTFHGEESVESGATPVPSYTFVDAGISYNLTDDVKVQAAIYNLLDKEVDYDTYGYVEDGRRYWFGMDVAF